MENNPPITQLWLLSDFSATLDINVDNFVVYYDFSSDLFKLWLDQGGISDVVDSFEYVWTLSSWTLLEDAIVIIDINTNINQINLDQIDQNTNISNLQLEQTQQNTDISNLQLEQIDQNTNISNLQLEQIDQNTNISNLQLEQTQQNTDISDL